MQKEDSVTESDEEIGYDEGGETEEEEEQMTAR